MYFNNIRALSMSQNTKNINIYKLLEVSEYTLGNNLLYLILNLLRCILETLQICKVGVMVMLG